MNEVNSTVPPSGLNDGARLIVRLLVTIETSNPSTDITRISFARPPRRDAKAIRDHRIAGGEREGLHGPDGHVVLRRAGAPQIRFEPATNLNSPAKLIETFKSKFNGRATEW